MFQYFLPGFYSSDVIVEMCSEACKQEKKCVCASAAWIVVTNAAASTPTLEQMNLLPDCFCPASPLTTCKQMLYILHHILECESFIHASHIQGNQGCHRWLDCFRKWGWGERKREEMMRQCWLFLRRRRMEILMWSLTVTRQTRSLSFFSKKKKHATILCAKLPIHFSTHVWL